MPPWRFEKKDIETIMVNCNPETVSTDYDTSDRLYFEPLTEEDVLNIIEREQPLGVVLQFGGQTPLKLAIPLSRAGVPILGTSPDAIDRAEDRERFRDLLNRLGLQQAESGIARSVEEAVSSGSPNISYPVMVRPSYVLGGRAMQIVYDEAGLLELYGIGRQSLAKPSRVDRQIPFGCHRGRCRCHLRWPAGGRRGNHGTYRRGRRALRRFSLFAAALFTR